METLARLASVTCVGLCFFFGCSDEADSGVIGLTNQPMDAAGGLQSDGSGKEDTIGNGDSAGTGGSAGSGGSAGRGGSAGSGGFTPGDEGESIGQYAARTCFTDGDDTPVALIDGLARQLVDAINCIRPGALSDLPDGNWQMLDPNRPALVGSQGVDDLLNAAAEGDRTMVIRWAYRDVSIQHLFHLWTLKGCDFATPAGLSNHHNGLAVDLEASPAWEPTMRRHGWENNIPRDDPHFDYVLAPDEGMATLALYAFQALWNRNRADQLTLTGELDPETEAALTSAPLVGFGVGLCDDGAAPPALPPLRGPTVAQSSWRGCMIPPDLVDGLTEQVARVMNCIEPQSFVPMSLCGGPGCIAIAGDPKPEWLETNTHDAVLALSSDLGQAVTLDWGFRDAALAQLLFNMRRQGDCPDRGASAGQTVFMTGQGFVPTNVPENLLRDHGFEPTGEGAWRWSGGSDLRRLAVYSFQALWNANRPARDAVVLDGLTGPATFDAIDRSPIRGFQDNLLATCRNLPGPDRVAVSRDCAAGCFNQTCPGRYDFCDARFGECAPVPCEVDSDCSGLGACDDPSRGSSPVFYCDTGRCRRR